ncbi:hypothetical protein JCM6882_001481 [Rhodosporidiobolus microsporus]
MDAGMAALRQQQVEDAAVALHRASRPPPATGDRAGFQIPHPHPYATSPPPHVVAHPPQARMSAPPGPTPLQSGGLAAQLGNVMLTPEDKQEGYDSSLAYLAPRGSPPGPVAPLPPVPQSAPPIPSTVPRYQLYDGSAPAPPHPFQQQPLPYAAVPVAASMAYVQPGMILPHPVSYPLPPPATSAPMPLPLPADPSTNVGLIRKPSLTVSAQAAQAHPTGGEGSPDSVPYRAHDSPMPFRSFNNLGGGSGSSAATSPEHSPPALAAYPRPHDSKSLPPPPMGVMGGVSDDSHDTIDMPVNPSSEKIWTDEVMAYRDIDDEEAERKKKKMKKGILIGVVALIIIAVIAIAVGVSVSKKNDDKDSADKSQLQASASSGSSSGRNVGTSFSLVTSIATLTGEDGEETTTARAVTRSSVETSSETSTSSTRERTTSSSSSSSSATTTTSSTTSAARTTYSSTTLSTTSASEPSTTPRSGQVVTRPITDDEDASVTATATSAAEVTMPTARSGRRGEDEDEEDDDEGFNLFDPSTWGSSHHSLLRQRSLHHRRH